MEASIAVVPSIREQAASLLVTGWIAVTINRGNPNAAHRLKSWNE